MVTKSTVPVGTGDRIARDPRRGRRARRISVASNPEFLREGAAIRDFKIPDRIVVGADDDTARDVLKEIYRPLFLNQAPILFTGRRTAELTKYAANAFLAMKISFINEMADLCEAVGADVQEVARGIGLDNRIGAEVPSRRARLWRQLLPQGHAGAAADRRGGRRRAAHHRRPWSRSMTTARRRWPTGSRQSARREPRRQARRRARPDLQAEHRRHARRAVDPADQATAGNAAPRSWRSTRSAASRPSRCWPESTFADDAYAAADGADALVIVTEWDEFRALDLDAVAKPGCGAPPLSICAMSTTGQMPNGLDWGISEWVGAKSDKSPSRTD